LPFASFLLSLISSFLQQNMKDLSTKILVLAIILFVAFGCSFIDTAQKTVQDTTSNKNGAANTARDTLGLKKSGIKECDELVDALAAKHKQNANAEQSWSDKAAEEFAKQQVYDQFSKNESNRTEQEKKDLADRCKLALEYFK
jgi:cell shape-determining protein MreC